MLLPLLAPTLERASSVVTFARGGYRSRARSGARREGKTIARILYIAGWGRSGSTILGNIIGGLPGVFDAGELRHFWSRAGRADHFCGCGESLADCAFWEKVKTELLADIDLPGDFDTVRRWQREATRLRRTRQVLRASSTSDLPGEPFAGSVGALRCLYRAIAQVSGAEVIVDSSKKPAYGALVRLASDAPVYVHLVRDPRATAHSWQRVKRTPGGGRAMPRHSAVASSINWIVCNLGGEMLLRRKGDGGLRIRYEDFVRSPHATVREIATRIGQDASGGPFIDEYTVDLAPNHTLAGNPSRIRHGPVSLQIDDEWVHEQDRADRLLCNLITLPLLRRYDYPLRVS